MMYNYWSKDTTWLFWLSLFPKKWLKTIILSFIIPVVSWLCSPERYSLVSHVIAVRWQLHCSYWKIPRSFMHIAGGWSVYWPGAEWNCLLEHLHLVSPMDFSQHTGSLQVGNTVRTSTVRGPGRICNLALRNLKALFLLYSLSYTWFTKASSK